MRITGDVVLRLIEEQCADDVAMVGLSIYVPYQKRYANVVPSPMNEISGTVLAVTWYHSGVVY